MCPLVVSITQLLIDFIEYYFSPDKGWWTSYVCEIIRWIFVVLEHHRPSLLSCLCPQDLGSVSRIGPAWLCPLLRILRASVLPTSSHEQSLLYWCIRYTPMGKALQFVSSRCSGGSADGQGVLETRLHSSALEESKECWGWRVRSGC